MGDEMYRESVRVAEQKRLTEDIFSLKLISPRIAAAAKPGQFLSLYCRDESRLLPRPISICQADGASGTVRLVYRVAGAGTGEFSALSAGDRLDVLGPLGNGFPTEAAEGRRAMLIGGGIGLPPILGLAGLLDGEKEIVLGYRDVCFLADEFETAAAASAKKSAVHIATEDGSTGVKGNVLDVIRARGLKADVVYACGPTPMLRALQQWALETGTECYLSLEQRMACGVGACLACVCETVHPDAHSKVNNARICAEGPVFEAREIVL